MVQLTFLKLSPALRKFWLTLHVGFSVSWLGMSAAMTGLSLIGLLTHDLELRRAAYAIMHLFDLTLIIPLVLLSLITGLIVALGTPWGLFHYWWVVVKLVISLGIVSFAAAQENFWVRGLAEQTARQPASQVEALARALVICMVSFFVALWIATILSIYKPWGRTAWGERQHTQRKAKAQEKFSAAIAE